MTTANNLHAAIRNQQSNEEVLNRVEASVGLALDGAKEREREAEALVLSGGSQEPVLRLWSDGMRVYQEKLRNIQTVAERAGASVASVDASLAEAETGFRDWLAATARAREKLTAWLEQSAG